MADQVPAAPAKRGDAFDELAVDLTYSGEDCKEDQYRDQDKRECDLRREADAEPDHEQRGQYDARNRIEQRHHRLEQLRKERRKRGSDAEHDAGEDAERKSAKRGGKGCFEMRPDAAVGKKLDERRSNAAWTRGIDRIEHVGVAGRFP